jgi:hypothetical protein
LSLLITESYVARLTGSLRLIMNKCTSGPLAGEGLVVCSFEGHRVPDGAKVGDGALLVDIRYGGEALHADEER